MDTNSRSPNFHANIYRNRYRELACKETSFFLSKGLCKVCQFEQIRSSTRTCILRPQALNPSHHKSLRSLFSLNFCLAFFMLEMAYNHGPTTNPPSYAKSQGKAQQCPGLGSTTHLAGVSRSEAVTRSPTPTSWAPLARQISSPATSFAPAYVIMTEGRTRTMTMWKLRVMKLKAQILEKLGFDQHLPAL